ncbi:ThuA domain-containing protein [Proteiniphilum sp.]|uniref:ThuA domain-containing protein n=1 Tax=Proteiniphilum sp. TaxID=1926877 RepID=UPI003A0FF8B7
MPSAREIPPVWEVEDELYILKEMNPTIRGLMVSDFSSPNFQHSKPLPNTFGSVFPSVWCNEFDGGRQWVTALGHKKEAYSGPLFISHIVGGLQWVLVKK